MVQVLVLLCACTRLIISISRASEPCMQRAAAEAGVHHRPQGPRASHAISPKAIASCSDSSHALKL